MSPSVRLSSRKGWGHLNSSAADNRMCSARHLGVCSSTCCHGCFVTKGAFFSWEILVITLCSSCFFRNRTPRSVTAHATCWASGPRVPALPSPFSFRYNGFSLLRYLPKASGKLRTFVPAIPSAWNALLVTQLPLSPTLGLCSNVTFSVRPPLGAFYNCNGPSAAPSTVSLSRSSSTAFFH